MTLILRVSMVELSADADPSKRFTRKWLEVITAGQVAASPLWKACVPEYQMMCESIMGDIQSAGGSGAAQIENVRRIEHGETAKIEAGGNAWVTHLTRDKVWFEGLYGQGEGGEVSFAQYKLAVQTYVRFLADPEHRPIEIVFPA
jgi:hypothetical protein